jgi:hypothetical protein
MPRKGLMLIIEPNQALETPYIYFRPKYQLMRADTIARGQIQLDGAIVPDLVAISTSFTAFDHLRILELIKSVCVERIVPIIFVVDWSKRMSTIPGTTWGDSIGLAHSLSSEDEVLTMLKRVQPSLPRSARPPGDTPLEPEPDAHDLLVPTL